MLFTRPLTRTSQEREGSAVSMSSPALFLGEPGFSFSPARERIGEFILLERGGVNEDSGINDSGGGFGFWPAAKVGPDCRAGFVPAMVQPRPVGACQEKKMKRLFIALMLVGLAFRVGPSAAEPFFAGGPGYSSLPLLTQEGDPGSWTSGIQSVAFGDDGTIYFFAENRYILKRQSDGSIEELYDFGDSVFGSFVRLWGDTVYFGESSAGTVKSIPATGGIASELFALENIYDCAFNSQSRLFFSANPEWAENRIYAWWPELENPRLLADVEGNSGPLAFDGDDNLYYGLSTTYPPGPEDIVYFNAAAVADAISSEISLTADDWTVFAAGADASGSLVFDRGSTKPALYSAAGTPGTLSRITATGVCLAGGGSYPGALTFAGTGGLNPFLPSQGRLGVTTTDYDDSYDSTLYLISACPQNFILGGGNYRTAGKSEIAIFRPVSGLWSVSGGDRFYFGQNGDLPVAGDYTGGGTARPAIFRPSSGLWAVRGSNRAYFGRENDIPLPRDYSGDGILDRAIFRPATGLWSIQGQPPMYFGAAGDFPLPGDYNGTGTIVPAVFRPATGLWAVSEVTRFYFGHSGDLPVPGDYRGEGTESAAFFRPATGLWSIRGRTQFYFGSGAAGDIPVPLDLNGDGTLDPAIFRPSTGLWAVRDLTRTYYGSGEDFPATR